MTNRELLKEAIADAKAVKEVAITNAKAALEEAFTPQIKSMFEKQIMEMEKEEEKKHSMEEEMHDEKKHEETVEEDLDEDLELEALLRELEEAEEEESEEESEEDEKEEEEGEEEEELDLDFDEMEKNPEKFADLIEKIVDEVIDEMIADGELEAGHEGMEDEPGVEMGPEEAPEEAPAEEMPLAESLHELEMGPVDIVQAAMITLGSLGGIIGAAFAKASHDEKKEAAQKLAQAIEKAEGGTETEKELEEAYAALEAVKTELNEVNLLNSKLLYVNKIFKAKNLTEAQKVHVLAAFDKAETVKESKLIYETLSESLSKVTATAKKKEFVTESKSFASKSVGTSPKQPVVEVNPVFERMKKLAGLK